MENPFFSIVVPVTKKNAYLLPFTLDAFRTQKEGSFEVILVDGTRRRVCEHGIYLKQVKIIFAPNLEIFALANRGVTIAAGEYIHFLFPGEFYVSNHLFSLMEKWIRGHEAPDVVYTGCFHRHRFDGPTTFMQPIKLADLKGVRLPLGLHSFWFCKETLLMMGLFREDLVFQSGYDLVCRIFVANDLRKIFMRKIFTDSEYRSVPYKEVIRSFHETVKISLLHFGISWPLLGWIGENYARLIHWWWNLLHLTLVRKKSGVE